MRAAIPAAAARQRARAARLRGAVRAAAALCVIVTLAASAVAAPSPTAPALRARAAQLVSLFPPCVCPHIYAPVCGERGGARETYGNRCECECVPDCAVVADGLCASAGGADCPAGGACAPDLSPVCCAGAGGAGARWALNACVCECVDGGAVVGAAQCGRR